MSEGELEAVLSRSRYAIPMPAAPLLPAAPPGRLLRHRRPGPGPAAAQSQSRAERRAE